MKACEGSAFILEAIDFGFQLGYDHQVIYPPIEIHQFECTALILNLVVDFNQHTQTEAVDKVDPSQIQQDLLSSSLEVFTDPASL
jgi:hypothetical protein